MPEWAALIISGLVLLAVGAFITFLTKMNGKIDVLTERITRAEESTRPLTQLIQAQLMGLLHHDEQGYEEADTLIDEFNEWVAACRRACEHRKNPFNVNVPIPSIDWAQVRDTPTAWHNDLSLYVAGSEERLRPSQIDPNTIEIYTLRCWSDLNASVIFIEEIKPKP